MKTLLSDGRRAVLDWRSVGMASLAIVLLSTAACSSEETAAPSSPASPEASSVDRQASVLANKLRVCVHNNASEGIALEWYEYMLDEDQEYLAADQLKKSLEPGVSDCAVSFAGGWEEKVSVYIEDKGTWLNSNGRYLYARHKDAKEVALSEDSPMTFTWKSGKNADRLLQTRVTSKDEMEMFGNTQAYPIDIYVSDGS